MRMTPAPRQHSFAAARELTFLRFSPKKIDSQIAQKRGCDENVDPQSRSHGQSRLTNP